MTDASQAEFDLQALAEVCPTLSAAFCRMVAEASVVCLEDQGHLSGIHIDVRGVAEAKVRVYWLTVTDEMRDTYADPEVATEHGAIAVSILTVRAFTEYTIIRRSMKGTGFDYWLSRSEYRPYRDDARLEISGIRSGDFRQLEARLRRKARQTDRSDPGAPGLPAYIAVVEFSQPVSYLQRREVL